MKKIHYLFNHIDPNKYLKYDNIKIPLYIKGSKAPATLAIKSLSDGLMDVVFSDKSDIIPTEVVEVKDRSFFKLLFEVKDKI